MPIAPLVSLLMVLVFSLVVTRVATVALTFTGLSRESARFQARSAFTGVGFTTNESESIAGHPVRRQIVMALMLLGNVGIVTAMASVIVTMVDASAGAGRAETMLAALGVVLVIAVVARSRAVERAMSRAIAWALERWSDLEVADYATLLHIGGPYGVAEVAVEPDRWLAGRSLAELALPEEGVLVLGVQRPDGTFGGVPRATTRLAAGDTVIAYGRVGRLRKIAARSADVAGARCRQEGQAEQVRAVREAEAATAA